MSAHDSLPSKERSLPALLREAERRVNQHVWGDRRAIVSIPARPDEDVDLLLMKAADQIDAMASVGIRQEREIERLQAVVAGMIQGLKDADRAAHETTDCVSVDEHERYKRCLYRANGRLIQRGEEPEKLDYPERPELKAFVQLCAPHGKDWLTCPECAKAAVNGK